MPDATPATLCPSLSYDDAPAAIEWLGRAFGFEKRLVVPAPDGTIRHSELSLGDAVIMVSSSRPSESRLSPRRLPGINQALCVCVADPDAHHARAKAAGASILQEPYDTDFGARNYAVEDLEGHLWTFGNYRPGAYWEKPAAPLLTDVVLKRFETPDEVREMTLGRFELVKLGGRTIGRATYQPGWKWSVHIGPTVGARRCTVEHVGLVLAGAATAAFDDGTVVELRAGNLFHIPATPHDSWVVGQEPYVSLHLLGAEHYAR